MLHISEKWRDDKRSMPLCKAKRENGGRGKRERPKIKTLPPCLFPI
jgi:hypothetical protein